MDIKEFIKSSGLKQSYLAKRIEWPPQSFSNWMNGRRGIPKEKLERIEKDLEGRGWEKVKP